MTEPSKEALEFVRNRRISEGVEFHLTRTCGDGEYRECDILVALALSDYAAARVAEARAQERERCARLCEELLGRHNHVVLAIRALAEQEKP